MITYRLEDGRIRGLSSPCGQSDANDTGTIDVTSNPLLPIILTNGWVYAFYVNDTGQLTQIPGVTFSSDYAQAFYKGQPITNGTMLATPYSSFLLSGTISETPSCTFPTGRHSFWTPLQSGPVYVKVVTDNGAIVNKGTVFVVHSRSPSDMLGSADYCLALASDTNATGYMQVADPASVMEGGDGLPLGDSYNFTLIAGYGGNQSFEVAIPAIVVEPGVITFVTISIPSGEVTTVTCNQGNSCTTTTSTSSAKGG